MEEYFKTHLGYKNSLKNRKKEFQGMHFQYKKDLKDYLNKLPTSKILEIGCGDGKFAYFCNKIGVKSYIGIDIDDYFFELCKKEYPNYKFIKESFQNYLRENENEFDIIFVSHVFEHLDEKERIEMIESIYGGLKKEGVRINYMPNANNFLYASSIRYGDITHKTIYTENSFSQTVHSTNLPFEIINKNICMM